MEEPTVRFVTLLLHYYEQDEYIGQSMRTVDLQEGLPLTMLIIDLHYGRRERRPMPGMPDGDRRLAVHNRALAEIFEPQWDQTRRDEHFVKRATSVRVMSFDLWHDDNPWMPK